MNAGAAVIIGIAIVPELVNHRLPVFLGNDHIGQIADQIAELLIREPWMLAISVHQKQPLEAPIHFRLELLAEMLDDFIGQPPQREVAGIVFPITGDVLVCAVLIRHLEELPRRPRKAVPHQEQEHIVFDNFHTVGVVKQFINISRQGQSRRIFFDKLSWQSVEQRQP